MKLLVIDDIDANLEMMKATFQTTDYESFFANNAVDGYEIWRREICQLIVVDWIMPEISGLDLIRRIRKHNNGEYVYIIMLTSKNRQEDVLQALESGVDDYVKRPASPRELIARVRIGERIISAQNALRESRAHTEVAKQEWEATADAIAQLVCLLDREGRILRTNRTLEAWGLAWHEDAPGRLLHELIANIYPNLSTQVANHWPEIQAQADQGQEYSFIADETTLGHHFQLHFEPIEQEAYTATRSDSYVAVSISDITERRNLELALKEQHAKSEALLLNILPEPISRRLKKNERVIADELEMSSVLFADLVGFTKFASSVPPAQLISVLNDVFSRFDALTDRCRLEKIKTIGDAYMAAAGVPVPKDGHAEAAVRLGLDMLRSMDDFNVERGLDLGLRVGIHSGPLIAGVIGVRKFAYDLWGDTVNIASRLESTGKPGQVHISQATADYLPLDLSPTHEQMTILKGIGERRTYFIVP